MVFFLFVPCVLHIVAHRYGCFHEFSEVLKFKAREFSSRARRREFITFSVANALFSYDLALIDRFIGTSFGGSSVGIFWLLYTILLFVPHVAVSVRRLHDTGRGPIWLALLFVPFGQLVLLYVLVCVDSEVGDNMYGPNPKGVAYHETVVNAEYVPVHVAQQLSVASTETTGDAPLLTQSTSTIKTIEPYRNEDGDDDSRTNLV